jgi:ribosomal protein S12 methylthiotransferase
MYPDVLTLKNLQKLKTFKKFIPYFDIPLQHISEDILKKMGRFYNQNHIFQLLEMIKNDFP